MRRCDAVSAASLCARSFTFCTDAVEGRQDRCWSLDGATREGGAISASKHTSLSRNRTLKDSYRWRNWGRLMNHASPTSVPPCRTFGRKCHKLAEGFQRRRSRGVRLSLCVYDRFLCAAKVAESKYSAVSVCDGKCRAVVSRPKEMRQPSPRTASAPAKQKGKHVPETLTITGLPGVPYMSDYFGLWDYPAIPLLLERAQINSGSGLGHARIRACQGMHPGEWTNSQRLNISLRVRSQWPAITKLPVCDLLISDGDTAVDLARAQILSSRRTSAGKRRRFVDT